MELDVAEIFLDSSGRINGLAWASSSRHSRERGGGALWYESFNCVPLAPARVQLECGQELGFGEGFFFSFFFNSFARVFTYLKPPYAKFSWYASLASSNFFSPVGRFCYKLEPPRRPSSGPLRDVSPTRWRSQTLPLFPWICPGYQNVSKRRRSSSFHPASFLIFPIAHWNVAQERRLRKWLGPNCTLKKWLRILSKYEILGRLHFIFDIHPFIRFTEKSKNSMLSLHLWY